MVDEADGRAAAQSDRLASIIEALDQPMVVVTTASGDERAGCLVGFHCQSSIDPGRYVVWLSKANHTGRVGLRASHLGVHFLDRSQHGLAERFGTRTGDDGDKFGGLDLADGPVPLLEDCPNRLLGRRAAALDEGGDHVCVVLEVEEVWSGDDLDPLRLSDVSDLEPGHPAEERPRPATHRAR
ncbi:flavin reductase family protein [Dermatobacter hominis]|uniref:flavin reductase family protein n=1 Tax=Dermatobacter hominis TaxID=2884263 RepID=UPI001D0F5443|nr:flavin reductase [Dermatobacter hominis]UDY35121.1 flavin reductase family protein [Dermatobacter hominis]